MRTLNVCNLPTGNKKSVQVDEDVSPFSDTKIAEECAGCGEKNPEYVLDDRHLCFDCYRAEKYYWAKRIV